MNKPKGITDLDWRLLQSKYSNLEPIIKKIENNYPVQYLIGNVNFYGYELLVNKHVLIPRFETEGLVEKTLKLLKEYHLENTDVLDIGTGSGAIAITLKKECPLLKITAIDNSYWALKVAKKNAKKNKAKISLIYKSIFHYRPINKYGLIISNPPYIDPNKKIDPKTKYEPAKALYANNKGLAYYDYIISHAHTMLQEKSIIAFEIGDNQATYLKRLAKKYFAHAKIIVEKDLAKKNRYLFIIND